ncbi:zinc ribbon domain-containing protein YjdM [Leucobacter sp. OH1287]|uniref:zinc ribbon domain-containing protein YjdM n=1 Tax=Leucobacter sp. OH1287 TaxID=2491049 RepID=UPI000F5E3AA1|nr:zinc ribbon domain-containing protein YjdM [Leucobacter sp. OH1287]RRD60350.1 alkylphosphonate utilization protein [Leucobacter sp. OH1287]
MNTSLPACPECSEDYTYENGTLLVCPMCGHEWIPAASDAADSTDADDSDAIRDAVGNVLSDGDSVTVVKSLKLKGSDSIKAGTKVRGIRLLANPVNGHDIEAKIPGVGQLYLKSSVVKKG